MENIKFPIYTKIRGISKHQDETKKCKAGDPLFAFREPNNEFDENAIAIMSVRMKKLGYLSADLAEDIAPLMDDGVGLEFTIEEITGGEDGKAIGCNITIEKDLFDYDEISEIKTKRKKRTEKLPPDKLSFKGCLKALFNLIALIFIGTVLIIIIIGLIKGW